MTLYNAYHVLKKNSIDARTVTQAILRLQIMFQFIISCVVCIISNKRPCHTISVAKVDSSNNVYRRRRYNISTGQYQFSSGL